MKKKIILFDADSLCYQATYKIITFGEIRELLQGQWAKCTPRDNTQAIAKQEKIIIKAQKKINKLKVL